MRRAIAGLGALVLIGGLAVSPPQETLASWAVSESATVNLGAITVPTPVISSCTVANNGLGVFQSVTMTWMFPAGSGYLRANSELGTGATQATITPTSPQPTVNGNDPNGPYSVTYSSAMLASLLGPLQGSTNYLGVRSTANGWSSPWAARKLSIGMAGTGASCSAP